MKQLSVAAARAQLMAPGAPYELTDVVVHGRRLQCFRHAPPHLRAAFEGTRQFFGRDAIVYQSERISFAELYAAVGGLAHVMRDQLAVGKGDRVVLGMRNLPEFAVAFWAAQALGAIAVPLNAWWSAGELRWALGDAAPQVTILDAERWDRLRDGIAELDLPHIVVTRAADPLPAGVLRWQDVQAMRDDLPPCEIAPDDPATILYTSGTTGRAKGALATQRNHCSLLMATGFQTEVGRLTAADPDASAPPAEPALLNPFPFFHIGGLSSLYLANLGGVKQVLMYKWDTAEALELCAKEQITNLAVVPTLLRRLLEAPNIGDYDLSGIAAIGMGGSPGSAELADAVVTRFGPAISVNHGYGLTETTSSICQHNSTSYLRKPQSVGPPVPGAEVRIVADGRDVPVGEPGEIWARGPQVVAGYWNNPVATAEAFVDGWFRSGDIGMLDEDGELTVLDRAKDVIIRGGENVYSAEVEAVLGEHPAVEEVAVVGLPDRDLGEIVAAVVVTHPGASVSEDELRELTAAHLAAFKVPVQWSIRSEPLPRNATGKVLKKDLRRLLVGA